MMKPNFTCSNALIPKQNECIWTHSSNWISKCYIQQIQHSSNNVHSIYPYVQSSLKWHTPQHNQEQPSSATQAMEQQMCVLVSWYQRCTLLYFLMIEKDPKLTMTHLHLGPCKILLIPSQQTLSSVLLNICKSCTSAPSSSPVYSGLVVQPRGQIHWSGNILICHF